MKGEPHVNVLRYFSCARDMVIDDLHAIYEGVVKRIMKLWFNSSDKLPYGLTKDQVIF
jgi:hypothetical protein